MVRRILFVLSSHSTKQMKCQMYLYRLSYQAAEDDVWSINLTPLQHFQGKGVGYTQPH